MRAALLPVCAVSLLLVLIGCGSSAVKPVSTPPPATRSVVGPIPGNTPPPAAASNPFGTDTEALAHGRRLFNSYNCSGCHGDHAGGGMGPSLRDESWIYGNSDAHIFASIAEGRARGMPAWGVKLQNDEIWRLTSYIRSMRTRAEPEPPQ